MKFIFLPFGRVNCIGRTRSEQIAVEESMPESLWPCFVELLGPYEARWRYGLRLALRRTASILRKLSDKIK